MAERGKPPGEAEAGTRTGPAAPEGPTEPNGAAPSRQRRTPRVPVRRRVESASAIGRVFGFTRDIGGGGLFLRTADLLPEGSELDLQVQLQPDSEPVTVHGRVVRTIDEGPERGMAIAFLAQGQSSERQFIQSFVREVELQTKLEQLAEAKRIFLAEVRAFQEEKLALERQRLAYADQEIKQAQAAQALRDEGRQLRREAQDKADDLAAHQRQQLAELQAERAKLEREQGELAAARDELGEARLELEADRQRLLDETDHKRQALADERQQLLAELERERKLLKALATRKAAEQEKAFDAQVVELQQQIQSLLHINEVLENRCRDLEHRSEAVRSDEAGRIAELRAQLTEQESRAAEQLGKQKTARAHLEATVAQLRQQLMDHERARGRAQEEEQARFRHLQESLRQEQAQVERLNAELDDLDGLRAQLVADLDAAREQLAELEGRLAAAALERDEAKAHADFRDSMMLELQARVDESLAELEAERAALDAERQRLAAGLPPTFRGAPAPAAAPTAAPPDADSGQRLGAWFEPVGHGDPDER